MESRSGLIRFWHYVTATRRLRDLSLRCRRLLACTPFYPATKIGKVTLSAHAKTIPSLAAPAARGAVLDKLADGDTVGTRTGAKVPAAARDTGATEITYRDAVTDALLHRHSPACTS